MSAEETKAPESETKKAPKKENKWISSLKPTQWFGSGKIVDLSWDRPVRALLSMAFLLWAFSHAAAFISWGSASLIVKWETPSVVNSVGNAALDVADGEKEEAEKLLDEIPDDCFRDAKGKGGGESRACNKKLGDLPKGEKIGTIVDDLEALELTQGEVKDSLDVAKIEDEETDGWGVIKKAYAKAGAIGDKLNPPSLKYKKESDKFKEDALVTGKHLKEMAKSSVTHLDGQKDAIEEFEKESKNLVYEQAGQAAKEAGPIFLLLLVLLVVVRVRNGTTKWMRWAATAVLAVLVISEFGKSDADVLGKLTLADGTNDAYKSLLGPFALIISQVLIFVQEVVKAVLSPDWEKLIMAATIFLVVTRKSKWAIVGGAYVLLTVSNWKDFWTGVSTEGSDEVSASALEFSPFNLDALDASWTISLIVWSVTLLGYIVTLYLAVGAWRHVAMPAADKMIDALGLEAEADAPASGASSAAAASDSDAS